MDPLVQRFRFAGIYREILDEFRHAPILPGPLKVDPYLLQRLVPQVAADERQRVDELDEPVR